MRRLLYLVLFVSLTIAVNESHGKTIRIEKKLPIQDQLKGVGAVYSITESIDLAGKTVSIPYNSTLRFSRKGSLNNGTIEGNSTTLEGKPLFDRIHLKGSFINSEFKASWCSDRSVSDFIEDVMNLSRESLIVVDKDITLNDKKKVVDHLYLVGKNKTIIDSDRFYIRRGGCTLSNLRFRWSKSPVVIPSDNYSCVVAFSSLLQKDTTVKVSLYNIQADGGKYCSYFMKQHRPDGISSLQVINTIDNCSFTRFTRGAILTCGGSGAITNCSFDHLGYECPERLLDVIALRLGMQERTGKEIVHDYVVKNCHFSRIVAPFNDKNDGRELHGLIAYGNSIIISDNVFQHLSTSFDVVTDSGMDAEMIYIKGSNNYITNNMITDGVGGSSDGVITLKQGMTEKNVIRHNQLIQTNGWGCFIQVSGRNHTIDNNVFSNQSSRSEKIRLIAIYLLHRPEDSGHESIVISNNKFSFAHQLNVLAIYANKWEQVALFQNTFVNPSILLTNKEVSGKSLLMENLVKVKDIDARGLGCFMDFSNALGDGSVLIKDNSFVFINSSFDRLVACSDYSFSNNSISLENSAFKSLLRGGGRKLSVENNIIECKGDTSGIPNSFIGESPSFRFSIGRNRIIGKTMSAVR